jgi:hypothetical protein
LVVFAPIGVSLQVDFPLAGRRRRFDGHLPTCAV